MGRIGWILIVIGVMLAVLGFIRPSYPMNIHRERWINITWLEPSYLTSFPITAGTCWNFTYDLHERTHIVGSLSVKTPQSSGGSHIDFYITDSARNTVLNAGRIEYAYSLDFYTTKGGGYTFCFDNTYDKNDDKLIDYQLLSARYLAITTGYEEIYLLPWFFLLGQTIYFLGIQLTFKKTFPYVVAHYSGLLVTVCSFFLFVRSDWFIISLLTILASSTYISHKLNNPELAFKTLFSSTILACLAFLFIISVFPTSMDFVFPKSTSGYPFSVSMDNPLFAAIVMIAAFTFVATIVNIAGIFLNLSIPEKQKMNRNFLHKI